MEDKKKIIAVIFGGPSVEHDVSIITGIQVIENLNKKKYSPIPIYWTRDNEFLTCSNFDNPKNILKQIYKNKIQVQWDINDSKLIIKESGMLSKSKNLYFDLFLPALHGTDGEDGTIQGLLEIMRTPYVGSNVGSSYLSMDKNIFKYLMKANDINVLPWQKITAEDLKNLKLKFDFPIICKPTKLGSSIGVKRCKNLKQTLESLRLIFEIDDVALIEPYIADMIEINCSVLGDSMSQEISACERPLTQGKLLNFEDKYLSGSKTKTGTKQSGMASLDRIIPADISDSLTKSIQQLAKKVFVITNCSGVVRVDFIVRKKSKEIIVNEVNAIPGSFAYYLWEAVGVSFEELLDKLVSYSITNFKKKKNIKNTFDSPVLKRFLTNS